MDSENCKPLPPTEVEVLAVVAGHSPESFFQDAADIVTYTTVTPGVGTLGRKGLPGRDSRIGG